MIYSILFFLLQSVSFAHVFTGYAYTPRVEKETSNKNYEVDSRHSLFVGYARANWKAQLQYSNTDESTRNGASSIEMKSHEWIVWGKYQLPLTAFDVRYYGGLGLGVTWDKIETSLGTQTVSDTSDREIVLGAVFEGEKLIVPWFSIGSDIKLIYSQYYSQRPTIELGLIQLSFYF